MIDFRRALFAPVPQLFEAAVVIERIDELARAARCAGPALRAFQRAGIPSFSALTECTEPDLTALHGMGPQVMSVLKTSQAERGLPEEGSNG